MINQHDWFFIFSSFFFLFLFFPCSFFLLLFFLSSLRQVAAATFTITELLFPLLEKSLAEHSIA